MIVLVLAVFSLGGCSAPTEIQLDARFRPLVRVREASAPGLRPGQVMTLYTDVVTADLADLTSAYRPGSVEWDALMLHERQHSIREFEDPSFLARYAASRGFRWQEEKIGWSAEIAHLRVHGRFVDVAWIAETLSRDYGGMVGLEDARAWAEGELAR